MNYKKQKIFIGLAEIAGHYHNLKKGFSRLGYETLFIDLFGHPFKYGEKDAAMPIVFYHRKMMNRLQSPKKSALEKVLYYLAILSIRILILIYSILTCKVFIFSFGHSFFTGAKLLNGLDLILLKTFGKKVIFRFHGADCRPVYLSGGVLHRYKDPTEQTFIKEIKKQKRNLKRIEKYADVVISNPLFSHFLEKPFVSAAYIGLPIEINNCLLKSIDLNSSDTIRIVHAPSNPIVKGSHHIRRVIDGLKKSGFLIDYLEITGLSNDQVLEQLASCDFVVDQLYADSPISGLAVEAGILGKPSILCGYAANYFKDVYNYLTLPPIIYCLPSQLDEKIRDLIINKRKRINTGKKIQSFISHFFNPEAVAKRYVAIIKMEYPSRWIYPPNRIQYPFGAGQCIDEWRRNIRSILKLHGSKALQLYDKEALANKICSLAAIE